MERSARIKLEILDLRGRVVSLLASGSYTTGVHVVVWDGTDDRGERAASGIYFYRVNAGEFTATKKMTLMK